MGVDLKWKLDALLASSQQLKSELEKMVTFSELETYVLPEILKAYLVIQNARMMLDKLKEQKDVKEV